MYTNLLELPSVLYFYGQTTCPDPLVQHNTARIISISVLSPKEVIATASRVGVIVA